MNLNARQICLAAKNAKITKKPLRTLRLAALCSPSRSLLSFVRHDYFRRILCRWIEAKIAAGRFPDDAGLIEPLLKNVCCLNAKQIIQ